MTSPLPPTDQGEMGRLLDENEQLRTALESLLEQNGQLSEDVDRLSLRLTNYARREPQTGSTPAGMLAGAAIESVVLLEKRGQADEELRVAFEELQVLTEELEVANSDLAQSNRELDWRVEERTRELERTNAALGESERRFRTLAEGIPQLVWRSAQGGHWTWCSPQWTAYTGLSRAESCDEGWLSALHPDDRASAVAAWARADDGQPLDFDGRIYHRGEQRYRHFRTRAMPTMSENGHVLEWLGTSTDVDDMLQLQRHQSVLVAELQHRTRNLMAVVQAVMQRTIAGSTNLKDFETIIADRLSALARVQGLLSRRDGMRISFDALLRDEFAAHVSLNAEGQGFQVSIEGPVHAYLRSATVQTLALAVHELTTNALKYGALSVPTGHLHVRWAVEGAEADDLTLAVDWRESGVPTMPALTDTPRGGGYGRELIERALPYQLGASTSYRFESGGVHCTIRIPVVAESGSPGANEE